MISLKTVFNYIKFANELTNKVSFMFNGIKKYVVRIVCVIMLLLVQFDVSGYGRNDGTAHPAF